MQNKFKFKQNNLYSNRIKTKNSDVLTAHSIIYQNNITTFESNNINNNHSLKIRCTTLYI